MGKRTASQVLAANLAEAMRRKKLSQVALAAASGVPQTTISLYLRPAARQATHGKAMPSPTVERLAMLAAALGVEPWQLLHPDPEKAQREADFYAKLRQDFDRLNSHGKQRA